MDEKAIMWLVLIAVSTIITLFKAVGQPVLKLNSSIIEATLRSEQAIEKLSRLESSIEQFQSTNRESHGKLHERIDAVEDDVDDLNLRVTTLEHR